MPQHSVISRETSIYGQPPRWLAYIFVPIYNRIAFRIRSWGSIPRKRGATLIVANHQHEIESPLIVGDLGWKTFSPRYPIFTVSSRRMWEPGFFAERIPWLKIARETNLGWFFQSLGMMPIENELTSRPYASIAYTLLQLEGDLPVQSVFNERALAVLPPGVENLSDLLAAKHFAFARSYVRIPDVLEPYKERIMQATRAQLDADIARFEALVHDGATIFLAPEGFYSGDGKMQKLRGILAKLQKAATIYLAAISYDPYDSKRLTMLYRVTKARDGIPLDLQLKGTRPVTTSAIFCTWLADRTGSFTEREAIVGVTNAVQALPANAFFVPELQSAVERAVHEVIGGMVRRGTLEDRDGRFVLTDRRTHPEFPHTTDMVQYQVNFHRETLDGLRAIAAQ